MTPGLRRDPAPDLDVGQEEDLVARMRAEIDRDGPLTFARFMDLALYDPEGGYYRGEAVRPGRADGDFLTAPEAHPIFGAALARAVADAWDRLDRPDPFVLREYGAGTGTLALAILDGLRRERLDLAEAIRYEPLEMEPRRIEAIESRLRHAGWGGVLRHARPAASPIDGFVLGNEVLDALPTHRVVVREGRLREVMVGWRDGAFVDIEADPSTPALAARLATESVPLSEGQRAEICLAIEPWVAAAAAGLRRGVVLLIDYGYPAAELYDPTRRRHGTLRAYIRHRVHDDPYLHVGRQDLTAHVDISAVERSASAAGLLHLGTTTQAEFLVGLGTGELLQAIQGDPATTMEDYLAVRSALLRLLDPSAMGRFRVMGFARGWPAGTPLIGFGYRLSRQADAATADGARPAPPRPGPHLSTPDPPD